MRSSSMRCGRRLRCTSSPCAIAGLGRGSEQRTRAAAREREARGALSYPTQAKVTRYGVWSRNTLDVSCFVGFTTLKNTSSHGSESGRVLG